MPFRAETTSSYVTGLIFKYLADQAMRRLGQATSVTPVRVETRFRYNQDFLSVFAIIPAVNMLVLVLIPAMVRAVGVVREKEMGSIANFRSTPRHALRVPSRQTIPLCGDFVREFSDPAGDSGRLIRSAWPTPCSGFALTCRGGFATPFESRILKRRRNLRVGDGSGYGSGSLRIRNRARSRCPRCKMPSVQINVDATAMTQAGNGAMPVTPLDVMLSKIWASGLVIIVAALLSLWLVVQWLLQVPIAGSIMLFVASAILYQFTVTAPGLFLATFTTSMAQFGLLVIPVLMVMNLVSGSTTPQAIKGAQAATNAPSRSSPPVLDLATD